MSAHRASLVCLLLFGTVASADGLYKWVDEKGAVHYSDNLPPTSQPAGISRLDKQGQLLRKAESVADKAAREAAEAQNKQQQLQKREQQRYDNALQERFHAPEDITAERDKQLQILERALSVLQSQQQRATRQLASLWEEARKQRSGKAAQDGLASQIAEQQRQLDSTNEQLKSRRDEIGKVRSKADYDIQRLRQLGTATP